MTGLPAEFDIDLMSGRFFAENPYPAFAWMRRESPVFYDEANELWALASYRDIKAAETATGIFSNAGGIRPKLPPFPDMIDMDPPEHTRRRRLVSAAFTPRRVQAMEDRVRTVCDEIIDDVCERGTCDFVKDIAAPLPLIVIGDLLGAAPEDRGKLLRWSDDMFRSQDPSDGSGLEAAGQAFTEYTAYIQPILEERRRTGATDDLVGVLVQAEIDGDRLDEQALIHETLLILTGGDETTRHVLSGGMHALLEHPDQLQRVRGKPNRLRVGVEELLRWVSPVKNMVRTMTSDSDVAGTKIPRGGEVMLLYPSANRDELVFDRPEVLDVTRDPNPHLAFGFGAHYCLGNQLARIELRVMFERLFERLPDLALSRPGPFKQTRSNFISGLEFLPVAFTPTAPIVGAEASVKTGRRP